MQHLSTWHVLDMCERRDVIGNTESARYLSVTMRERVPLSSPQLQLFHMSKFDDLFAFTYGQTRWRND
jgi:hypothetical protein